jgi:hypothetical protein
MRAQMSMMVYIDSFLSQFTGETVKIYFDASERFTSIIKFTHFFIGDALLLVSGHDLTSSINIPIGTEFWIVAGNRRYLVVDFDKHDGCVVGFKSVS